MSTTTEKISSDRSYSSILFDEIAYRVLRFLVRRASSRTPKLLGLCLPTNDLICHRVVSTGAFEATHLEAITRIVGGQSTLIKPPSPDTVFVDVGANVGIYSAALHKSFAKVLAIEANPDTHLILRANMNILNAGNVHSLCLGASSETGSLRLNVNRGGNLGWSSFEERPSTEYEQVETKTDRLDNIVSQYADRMKVGLLKIDVEGHELEVIKGALDLLERDRPIVLYENLEEGSDRVGRELEALGYKNFYTFQRRSGYSRFSLQSRVVISEFSHAPKAEAALICAVF